MKIFTSTNWIVGFLLGLPFFGFGQIITNVNTSSQNCQGDTVTVFFAVTQPLNPGNQFRVELSTPNPPGNTFTGNFIELAPLSGFNIGPYSMQAVIPSNSPQGLYQIRITGSNPLITSDTLSGIIVGRRPSTDITIYGTYTFNNTQRYCIGDTAILVGPQPLFGETHQYQWFENGTPMPGATNDTLFVTGSASYAVRVTLGLCDKLSKDTIVNAYTPPTFIFPTLNPDVMVISNVGFDSILICEGTTATINGPTSSNPNINFRYQWLQDSIGIFGQQVFYPLIGDTLASLDVNQAGTYYLEVLETIGGCRDTSMMFSVFVDTIPTGPISAIAWPWQQFSTLNLCPEDSVLLRTSFITSDTNVTYQWQASFPIGSPFIDIPGVTQPELTYFANIVSDTIAFRLIIKNRICTYTSNVLTVNYFDNPTFQFFPSDSVATCLGDSVLVQISGNGISYTWSDGFIGANRWVKDAGSYAVTATGINQCTSVDTLKVGIFQVNAVAGPDITIYKPEVNVQLNASGGVSYFWYADKPTYFNNQFIANPIAQPTSDTTQYFVEVIGPNGCKDIASLFVYRIDTMQDLSNIQNVITPNGDGRNDFLEIDELLRGDDCEMIILDRWGNQVYYSFPYINSWNGITTGGAELPDGTYYFIVKFNNAIRYKGPVTIIRNSK